MAERQLDRLASLVDPGHATLMDSILTVSPATPTQASAVLSFAFENRLPVSLEGSGTKQRWINPGPTSLRLLTHRMNTVREHIWQDMTCTVEAGCRWQDLQTTLSRHGQQVALDPLWPERSTVGGVVASNDSGALRLHYGGLRDLVIGMTLILADGTIARSGGKVVKNVAGYDLPKLLCGSFGTLALIAEVTFRLHSIAPDTEIITIPSREAASLGSLMLRLLDSHLSIQSMQLRTDSGTFALDVRLAALPSVLIAQRQTLTGIAATLSLSPLPTQTPWRTPESLLSPGAVTLKATMLPTQIAGTVQAIHALGGQAIAQAVGTMIASLPAAIPNEQLTTLRSTLEAGGGSLVLLDSPSADRLDRWGTLPDSLPLMRSIKRQFDPQAILNPGRFLGGI